MNLGKKLYLERKYRNLTKKELSKELNKTTNFFDYSKKDITILESGQKEFTFHIVDDIAKYFNMTISQFLTKEWKSYNTEEITLIENNIEEYFHGHSEGIPKTFKNLSDIVHKFDLVNHDDWVAIPKYDFIMREYYDYLYRDVSKYRSDVITNRAEGLLDKLQLFSSYDHKNELQFPINVETDSPGYYTKFNDKREPINMNILIQNIEWSLSEIRQLFEDDYFDYYREDEKYSNSLKHYREKLDIGFEDIEKDLKISSIEYMKWEKDEDDPSISSILKLCDYLNINIDLLSPRSLRTMNNINSQSIGAYIFQNTNVHSSEELSKDYYFSERQSIMLIPKYCYKYMFDYLEDKTQKVKEIGIKKKKAFQFTREFFVKWYEFNKARQFLFYSLEGLVAKENFIHYTEQEIKKYLGDSYYPENPVKILTQLALDRVENFGYKDKKQILKRIKQIDIERVLKPVEKTNLRPEIDC
jgi:transcriptional regulator with XRE-family HTH domain